MSFFFAGAMPGCDIAAHGKVILESKDPEFNFLFVFYKNPVDIKPFEQVVIESNNPIYSYKFARDIEGADVRAHSKVVVESENPAVNYDFMTLVESDDFNVEDHRQAIINSKSGLFNYKCAEGMDRQTILRHLNVFSEKVMNGHCDYQDMTRYKQMCVWAGVNGKTTLSFKIKARRLSKVLRHI